MKLTGEKLVSWGLTLAGGHLISTEPVTKKVILCIDDDASILRYETALLERAGYAVLTATSGRDGLNVLATRHCDAVLLDYEMPGLNGHDVAFEIKIKRPELVVILLSGSEVPTQALALVDAFVPKLEASRQLLPMIAELCSRGQDSKRRRDGV
jgi:CheY-like chemotaxis protein